MPTQGEIAVAFTELSNLSPLVGRGGQKEVYKASYSGRDVALKLILVASQDKARTEREIAAVSALNSDYVAKVFLSGIRRLGAEDRHFIVEQFITGSTLQERLRRMPILPLGVVMPLAEALLRACVDFEVAGLVHRDIKPGNLIIGNDGKVWVLDFGFVRMLDLESLTQTAEQWGVGTLGYSAPEQFRNRKPEINIRADLFSVGVVLHESLCGKNLYREGKRDPLAVIRHMESQDLPPLSIPNDNKNEFSDLIAALTSRFPSRRPQTACEALSWFGPIRDAMKGRGVI